MGNTIEKSKFLLILELSKVKITIAVSVTVLTGYVLGKGGFDMGFLLATIGIFLLACGASVLNHLQEHRTDKIMSRTKNRPIPAGKISKTEAVLIALIEIVSGSVILFLGSGLIALLLGLLALIWYSFVYTYLKKLTAHAVIPGSIIGAIPPLVGWVTAGQPLIDQKALVLALFFFVWQVPHFYLLLIKFGKEYEKAGFPSLLYSNQTAVKHIIFVWIILTVACSLLLFVAGVITSKITITGISILGLSVIGVFSAFVFNKKEPSTGKYFMYINYYVLLVVILLNLDHVLSNLHIN